MSGNSILSIQTEYSFGKAYAPIDSIITHLVANGVTAAGIVDSDTWGHVRWFNACKSMGITPLLGASAVVSDEDDRTPRMWFLAKNQAGLSELYAALSKSYHQQVKHRYGTTPRLYTTDVLSLSENVLVFLGDIFAADFVNELKATRGLVYADISSNGSSFVNNLKKGLGLPLVEADTNLYISLEDKGMTDFFPYCGKSLKDKSIKSPEHYLDTLQEIVDMCSGLTLPTAPMINVPGDLAAECYAAIPERFPNGWSIEYEQRLQHELAEIKAKRFDSYFLLVKDMVSFAKQHMLVGPSRGSAASSLVCFLLHITEIDPIPPKLVFERFIDHSRQDLPDIDLDFPDNKRELIFEYLSKKYGAEHVARVGNIAYYKPKSALIQVCKTLSIPPEDTFQLKRYIDSSPEDSLSNVLSHTNEGINLVKKYPRVAAAAKLEGHAVRSGIHAAGVLVCNDDLNRYCVIDNHGIAHIDKRNIEQVNLLKIDVLGLRTLSVIEDTGVNIDWYSLPLNDPNTFRVFNLRRFCGVFQFEGAAMRSVANRMLFQSIKDIDAITALARPGPLNAGVTEAWLERHAGAPYNVESYEVGSLLADTYGLPLYQEDTMRIVRDIGGFDWAQTSKVRKAISKSQGSVAIAPMRQQFMDNATKLHGLSAAAAEHLWSEITAMGAWQMNKAHTYSYAVISYWTAWLKANYPLEFAASALRHAKDDESAVALLRELVLEGLQYVWFDPCLSQVDWSVIDGKLVGGFKVITGIGDATAESLVKKRDTGLLTQADVDSLLKRGSVYQDVLRFTNTYRSYYQGQQNVRGCVSFINQIPEGLPHGSERVFLGRIVAKYIKSSDSIDLRLRDDTDIISARFKGLTYKTYSTVLDQLAEGTVVMVRAKFFNGFRFAFASKIKVIGFEGREC